MNTTSDQTSYNSKPNLIKRLFRGDISLPITYWVFGVGSGLMIRLGYFLIEKNFIKILMYEYGLLFIKAFNILTLLISLFIIIAIWRSANKYTESPGWALVAKIVMVLNIMVLLVSLYNQYTMDPEAALQSEISLSNKNLPFMVDEQTRLDKMSLNNHNIHYHYTILDLEKSEIDQNFFKVNMHKILAENSCGDAESLELLKEGRKLIFNYNDKNDAFVTDITVENYDCS